jgi:hypothetical protein
MFGCCDRAAPSAAVRCVVRLSVRL